MNPIEGISAWRSLNMQLNPTTATTATNPSAVANFKNLLMEGIQDLNAQDAHVEETIKSFLAGKGPELHTVMLNLEQARLSMEFAVNLRNKVLDAYSEIMRIQF